MLLIQNFTRACIIMQQGWILFAYSRASHVAKYFLTVCLQLRGRGHFNNCVKGRKRVGSEAFCSLVREYCYLMGAEISQFVEEMLKAK